MSVAATETASGQRPQVSGRKKRDPAGHAGFGGEPGQG